MDDKLVALGLSPIQAKAYCYLLEHGEASPTVAAKTLGTTRTNTYKLFDRLVELGLVTKKEVAKKFIYSLSNPRNISNIVAEERNLVAAKEETARTVLADLLAKYHAHTDTPDVSIVTGRKAVADAFYSQIQPDTPIYFLRSRMDIPVMGFETMHDIRIEPVRHNATRHGITPDIATGTTANPAGDTRSALDRTWIREEDYTAPVEWSVSGSRLLIVIFSDEPHAIIIDNPLVADAFQQICQLLIQLIKQNNEYQKLPRT